MIIIIVAMDRNRAIGARGRVPWHLSADLKRFKKLTMGHPIVMGRKTYESIGKPLPGRTNIVITRQTGYDAPGCTVVHRLEDALDRVEGDVFVIGGGEIYEQALPLAGKAYVTEVDTEAEDADAFFPELDKSWEREGEERHEGFRFVTFVRKSR